MVSAAKVVILGVMASVIAYFVIQKLSDGSSGQIDMGINGDTKGSTSWN